MTDLDRQLQDTLKRIVDENGTGVLLENNGRRAVAFAADYLPRAKKERKLLKIVLDTGIAGKIHGDVVVRKQDPLLCRKKYVLRVREDLSIEQGAAEFIVDCIFYAFGLDAGEDLSGQSRKAADHQADEDYRSAGDDRWADEDYQRAGDDLWADEDYRRAGNHQKDGDDEKTGRHQAGEDYRSVGDDRWADEDYQRAGDDLWADEDYRRAGNRQKDGNDQKGGKRRSAGDRPDSSRGNRPDTDTPPKKKKGGKRGLIAAGILFVLGLLIELFRYNITAFLYRNLEFGRFMSGGQLQRHLIQIGYVLLVAGVILAIVCVAGLLKKRRKK